MTPTKNVFCQIYSSATFRVCGEDFHMKLNCTRLRDVVEDRKLVQGLLCKRKLIKLYKKRRWLGSAVQVSNLDRSLISATTNQGI